MSDVVLFPGAWRCEAHRLWTNGDCPDCDDEQIADLDETYGEGRVND